MPPSIPRLPPSSTLLRRRRRRHLSSFPSLPAALFPSRNAILPQMPPPIAGIPACSPLLLFRRLCSSTAATQKLERIADDLLSLSDAERHDYSLLLRLRLRLPRFGPTSSPAGRAAPSATAAAPEPKEEKTAFDVKLESFDAAAKIKVIKEVRAVAELGLKEAKEMVEKAPVVVRRGVAKEEAEAIMARLKESGAKVVLE